MVVSSRSGGGKEDDVDDRGHICAGNEEQPASRAPVYIDGNVCMLDGGAHCRESEEPAQG